MAFESVAFADPSQGATPRYNILALIRNLRGHSQAVRFLIAHTSYEVGIETVMVVAVLFGHEELKLSFETLAAAILMVQFIGALGPLLFNRIADSIGPKHAILLSLACWITVLTYAYAFASTALHFFITAAGVAITIGGTQALSRSLLAGMIPHGWVAKFFGARDLAVASISWLGPVAFGIALQFTGSYRVAILSLVVYFAAGAAVLCRVDVRQAVVQAAPKRSATV